MGLRDKIVMLISEYWDFIGNVSFLSKIEALLIVLHTLYIIPHRLQCGSEVLEL